MPMPIELSVSIEDVFIDFDVSDYVGKEGGGGEVLPYYTGSYDITPKTVKQILPTNQRSMSKDLTIDEIPYSETTNPSGGETINIAYL